MSPKEKSGVIFCGRYPWIHSGHFGIQFFNAAKKLAFPLEYHGELGKRLFFCLPPASDAETEGPQKGMSGGQPRMRNHIAMPVFPGKKILRTQPPVRLFLKNQEAHLHWFLRKDVLPCLFSICEKWDLNYLRFKVGVLPDYFSASSTATATETVAPTMGLLPAPRKPIISTSNPPDGGFVPAVQGLLEKESRPFAKQEAHHLKAVCCAFLSWEYLITSTVHETRPLN